MLRGKAKEVTGVFKSHDDLEDAVMELETVGFARRHISVLAGEASAVDATTAAHQFGAVAVAPDLSTQVTPETARQPSKTEDEADAMMTKADVGVVQGATIATGILVGAILGAAFSAAFFSLSFAYVGVILGALVGGLVGGGFAWRFRERLMARIKEQIRKGGLIVWVKIPDQAREIAAVHVLRKHGAVSVEAIH